MKALLFVFSALLFFAPQSEAMSPRPCQKASNCMTRQQCATGLNADLEIAAHHGNRICGLNNEFYEWNMIRRHDIYPTAVRYALYYAEQGVYNINALEMSLIDMYYLYPDKIDQQFACTLEFYEQLGVGLLRSHDACYSIYRHYNANKHAELATCVRKRLAAKEDPDKAMNTCIQYIFY